MFPDRKTALQELAKAEELNPGPWGNIPEMWRMRQS